MAKFGSLRYAHEPGILHLAKDASGEGSVLLTGGGSGSEGEVIAWSVQGDVGDDEPSAYTAGRGVTALAWTGTRVVTGNERYQVQSYTYSEGEWRSADLITRFMTPVTHLLFHPEGRRLLAASSDTAIKWVSVEDGEFLSYRGHTAPILALALAPDQRHFASSACDGSVRIWPLPSGEEKSLAETAPDSVATIDNLWKKSNEQVAERTLAKLAFHPQSGELAVPTKNVVRIYSVPEGKQLREFRTDSKDEELSAMAIHPDGSRLVAASLNKGRFYLWSWESGELLWSGPHADAPSEKLSPTDILWHPSREDEIVFVLADGRISHASMPSAKAMEETEAGGETEKEPILYDEDELSRASDIGALKKQLGFDADGSFVAGERRLTTAEPQVKVVTAPAWKPLDPHPTFVPSSTPEGRAERYLRWNGVGLIRGIEPADEAGSLEIEFHDTGVHHSFSLDNVSGFSLADISSQALALAAPSEGETAALLRVQFLGAWDHESREWSLHLGSGEEPLGLALGEDFLALATSQRRVRIFSLGGLQRSLLSFQGNLVTLAAGGDSIALVTEEGLGLGGKEHALSLSLYRLTGRGPANLLHHLPMPLSPAKEEKASRLLWLGITEAGGIVAVDSTGLVQLLTPSSGAWSPIADLSVLTPGPSDTYWVTEVRQADPSPSIRAIMCKAAPHPYFVPRPIVNILDWAPPLLAEADSEEATLLSLGLATETAAKAERKALALLFAAAVRAGRERRAVELAQAMPDSKGVQTLIHFTNKQNIKRPGLVERLGKVALAKDEEAAAAEEEALERENRRPALAEEEEDEIRAPPQRIRLKAPPRISGPGNISANESLLSDTSLNASAIIQASPMQSSASTAKAASANPFKRKAPLDAPSPYDVFESPQSFSAKRSSKK